ncbi:MAG: YkgJ family cysteine cluster protein [Pseudomonadales bacterium]|nr:YkgJ family cysteine cluster protein [Pseudomonadales bacterium]
MECRLGCGACCIAPSITSPIPGMPDGKPAGVRCVQLDDDNLCKLFDLPERPTLCLAFKPCPDVCGEDQAQALRLISNLESIT